jgi:hypothetical protein
MPMVQGELLLQLGMAQLGYLRVNFNAQPQGRLRVVLVREVNLAQLALAIMLELIMGLRVAPR